MFKCSLYVLLCNDKTLQAMNEASLGPFRFWLEYLLWSQSQPFFTLSCPKYSLSNPITITTTTANIYHNTIHHSFKYLLFNTRSEIVVGDLIMEAIYKNTVPTLSWSRSCMSSMRRLQWKTGKLQTIIWVIDLLIDLGK